MSLPSGDLDDSGVRIVEAYAAKLEIAFGEADFAAKSRTLRTFVESLKSQCDPQRNPSAYRRCQASAQRALKPMLYLAKESPYIEVRLDSLEALVGVCFGNSDMASFVATSGLLEGTIEHALRPVEEIRQQQEHLAALQLVQAVSAVVPEAPAFRPLLPQVCTVLEHGRDGYAPVLAVRSAALEVLVSLSLSRSRRKDVAASLPKTALEDAIAGAEGEPDGDRSFLWALLLANLCDLSGPACEPATFAEVAFPLWERSGFFDDLGDCFAASLRQEPWPPQTGGFHSPMKLASTCLRLAAAGHALIVRSSAPSLIAVVERRVAQELCAADDARAARLAAVALHGLLSDGPSVDRMREAGDGFLRALQAMRSEEPTAADILEALDSAA